MTTQYKHLFGPVNSRRLGSSLGIDLIPYKTCSLNCVYCECGLTNNLTDKLAPYIPTSEIIDELAKLLKFNPEIDYITFSGSGEPTLNSGLFEICQFLKQNFPQYKICLITNSTTLINPIFYQQLIDNEKLIDLIMPSLDAVSQDIFETIDQPLPDLRIESITEALINFTSQYHGKIWLEIFIIPGINDSDSELNKFVQVIPKIHAERILLNCLDRIAPYNWVKAATAQQMTHVKEFFANHNITSEIIGKVANSKNEPRQSKS